MRVFLAEAAHALRGNILPPDPGSLRLLAGLRSTLGGLLSLLLVVALGAILPLAHTDRILGFAIGLFTAALVRDPMPRQRGLTMALVPPAAFLATAVATVLTDRYLLSAAGDGRHCLHCNLWRVARPALGHPRHHCLDQLRDRPGHAPAAGYASPAAYRALHRRRQRGPDPSGPAPRKPSDGTRSTATRHPRCDFLGHRRDRRSTEGRRLDPPHAAPPPGPDGAPRCHADHGADPHRGDVAIAGGPRAAPAGGRPRDPAHRAHRTP